MSSSATPTPSEIEKRLKTLEDTLNATVEELKKTKAAEADL